MQDEAEREERRQMEREIQTREGWRTKTLNINREQPNFLSLGT